VTATLAEPPARAALPSGGILLLAVTDLLVRGPGLRYSANPDDVAAELGRRLGVPVRVAVEAARTSRRDSWHAGWQLPRETMVGLAAGTVLRLTFDGVADAAAWHHLLLFGKRPNVPGERAGVGSRRSRFSRWRGVPQGQGG
jgi:hypothetical protein